MEFEVETRVLVRGGAVVVALFLLCLFSYRIGAGHGFDEAVFWTSAGSELTNGVLAVEALRAIEADDLTEARRTLDLLVDQGIASQSLYLEAHRRDPDETQPPDDSAVWLYQYLLDYRRDHPSSVADETRYLGPRVAEALAANR